MFENKIIEDIHTSRYIASWVNEGGSLSGNVFRVWLKSLIINGRHLTDKEVDYIDFMATNGKLELESSARQFLSKN